MSNQLREALVIARAGLVWYQENYPETFSECDNEALEQIDAALASQAQQESQWISVDERLPEEYQDVILLILDEYDQIQYAHGFYWKYEKANRIVWNQNSDFCTPQGGWDGATMDKDELNVTHWMPLPKRPNED